MRKWRPFSDPRDPSVWADVSQMYPTVQGSYRSVPGFTATATNAESSPGTELRAVSYGAGGTVDNAGLFVVGTSTKLWIGDTNASASSQFTDRSKGGGYTASDWSFAMYGLFMLAANGHTGVKIQVRDSTGSSSFADIAAAPKALIVVTQSNAVAAFYTDATVGDDYAISDVGDHTNWSTGEAVTSTRLRQRPGNIIDAIAYRDYIVVFKRSSMFKLYYVGGTTKWNNELLVDGVGAFSKGSAIAVGDRLYFWDTTGPQVFDGVSVKPLAPWCGTDPDLQGTRLLGLLPDDGTWPLAASYNKAERCVIWQVGATPANASRYYLVYNEITDSWGRFTSYKSSGTAFEGVMAESGDYERALANQGLFSINLSDGIYYPFMTVAPTGIRPSVRTSAIGDEIRLTDHTRMIPQLLNPQAALNSDNSTTLGENDLQLVVRHASNPYYLGKSIVDGALPSGVTTMSAVTSSNAQIRFDYTLSARWIDAEISATSGKFFEIADVIPISTPGGLD